MTSGDVATFGASTKSANGWRRRKTATYDSFFTPKSETHDGTTAFFEVDASNTDVYAYDMDSLDSPHTPAMARLPTCLYTPCQIYDSTSKSRNGTTTDYPDRETMNARYSSTEKYNLVYPSHH